MGAMIDDKVVQKASEEIGKGSGYEAWHSLAWAGAFVVTILVLVLSLASRAILLRNRISND